MVYFAQSSKILLQNGEKLFKSENDGESFEPIDSITNVYSILQHPRDQSTVLVFTQKEYWITEDAAANWRKIELPFFVSRTGSFISFNSADKSKMIIRLRIWTGKSFTEDVL